MKVCLSDDDIIAVARLRRGATHEVIPSDCVADS
jgi:hypothetical protein